MGTVQDTPAADQHLDRDDLAAIEQLRAERPASGPARTDNFAQVRRIRSSAVDNAHHNANGRGDTTAAAGLSASASTYIRWPWRALDELTGGMAPGSVHYVIAYSGGGKSTFLRSAMLRWAEQGVPLDILPLEEPPATFAVQMAAHALGLDPGPILSGDMWRESNAAEVNATVQRMLARMKRDFFYADDHLHGANPVRVDGAEGVTLQRLEAACEEAADRKARICLVDHVDHLGTGGAKMYEESVAVNRGALRLAQKHGLVMVLASQANQQALAGNPDYLAKYQPLRDNHVAMGGHKRQIASSMVSLYRPLRTPDIGESEEQYQNAIKRARKGDADPQTVLARGLVGCSLMKSRNYGNREGRRALLKWHRGQVVDTTEDCDIARGKI